MPVFQYACRGCETRFERLVLGQARPACPSCGSADLERLLSVFAVGSRETRAPVPAGAGACGSCGDPRGPGACSLG
jgi:putative FmdB family regulatory protein